MRKIFFAVLCMVFVKTNSYAQIPDLPIIHDSLYSEILKEMRPLEIVLPANYDATSKDGYDAFYVTDGEWNTRIVSDLRQFLNIQFTPENIIISIPNVYPNNMNQRGRDFTPTNSGMPESGGAEKFLAFIKTELIPYIDKKYKTNGQQSFYGSSLGGLFAFYILCKEPQLFQSYMIADPALWWDNNYIHTLLKANIEKLKSLHRTILVTGREGAAYQYMGVAKADSILHTPATTDQHWKTMLYGDETHNSMIFRTVYDGLKYTYEGYMKDDFEFFPMHGMLLNGKGITLHFNNTDLLKNIRYTTDGSIPTENSPKVSGDTLVLNGPSQLVVKSISNRDKYSKIIRGNFAAIPAALPASATIKNMQPGGFAYKYYEGAWDSLPDFKKLKPVQMGIADKDFDPHKLPRQKNFALVFEGQIEIKTDGYYTFGVQAKGGAKMFVGNKLLIDYNGIHNAESFRTFAVPLVKGFYPFRTEYFQKEGEPVINIGYIAPNANPGPIPLELQYAPKAKK
ncbi:MAG: alpha/beta hydrolase-fold protein [Agriterribacter sp.]